MNNEWIRVYEYAKLYNISIQKVYRLIREQKLKSKKEKKEVERIYVENIKLT